MYVPPVRVHNRANTPEEKRLLVDRLYEAWLRAPELRFGQFIADVVGDAQGCDVFYVEDFVLAAWAERFVQRGAASGKGKGDE